MTQQVDDPGQDAMAFDEREEIRREDALLIDIDGFEGPLDLLLTLARAQKVDLTKISILALTEQYLVFVAKARTLRLELAADYLVMASWLAYLKSRLLLPAPEADDEPSGEELAAHLAFRLQRLEAMPGRRQSYGAQPTGSRYIRPWRTRKRNNHYGKRIS